MENTKEKRSNSHISKGKQKQKQTNKHIIHSPPKITAKNIACKHNKAHYCYITTDFHVCKSIVYNQTAAISLFE